MNIWLLFYDAQKQTVYCCIVQNGRTDGGAAVESIMLHSGVQQNHAHDVKKCTYFVGIYYL